MMQDGEKILLAHGGGGELTAKLVSDVIIAGLGDVATGSLDDAAVIQLDGHGTPCPYSTDGQASGGAHLDVAGAANRAPTGRERVAFTTDSFVVKPLFFPGGDVGRLAVCGTVNDLSMRGARPLYISLAFIIEEGLEIGVLRRVVASIAAAAREAGVKVATGDTKVVERGSADGLFINTAGIGVVPDGVEISLSGARPGDEIVVSGPMGNHAIAVLAQREGLSFETTVESDAAPLNHLAAALVGGLGRDLHVLNDPTRGGLAASLNTIAAASGVAIEIDEESIPVDSAVAFAAEMLGLDVLTLANEGKLVAAVGKGAGRKAIGIIGKGAAQHRPALIGRVKEGKGVTLVTGGGGRRVLEMPYGEDAPRIC
jgi:hydrogenase expression/formation protein HypE